MKNKVNNKTISSVLLTVHNRLDATFWVNHDISKCADCQKALGDKK